MSGFLSALKREVGDWREKKDRRDMLGVRSHGVEEMVVMRRERRRRGIGRRESGGRVAAGGMGEEAVVEATSLDSEVTVVRYRSEGAKGRGSRRDVEGLKKRWRDVRESAIAEGVV
jgi:hypothetical protein